MGTDTGGHSEGGCGHGGERYRRIEDYGVIGDLHSAALVGLDGSIDWYCYPHFDSPSVLGALLDADKGGRFRIGPVAPHRRKQLYLPDTNVLITRFLGTSGLGEIVDFMPVSPHGSDEENTHSIIRKVEVITGAVEFDLRCEPAFDFARAKHDTRRQRRGIVFRAPEVDAALALATDTRLEVEEGHLGRAARGRFTLKEGEHANFVLQGVPETAECEDCVLTDEEAQALFERTVGYWRSWVSKSTYRGRWREDVVRSALALKLLNFQPTGAIVAAATTSLPEVVGGIRNWDYRHCWLRDAAFTVYALMRVGFTDEAAAFMAWLEQRVGEAGEGGRLRPVYAIRGGPVPPEVELDHLEGYRGSRPVRVGNAASHQHQLDVYGELMDAAYLYNKYGTPISYDTWVNLRRMLDWICEHWDEEDRGMWEMRGAPKHFTTSRMMTWVALDRGIRLGDKRSLPGDLERWRRSRDTIYEEVMEKGWDERKRAFVQRYDSDQLDASVLLMPLVFFASPTDPRMLSTIEAVQDELADDNLVFRYLKTHDDPDGLPDEEGAFTMCSFWLVEALTRAGRLDEARLLFEKMLGYGNHLGLFAEEIDRSGEARGNFPQAFTHISLISAAFNLDRALGGREP